MAYQFGLVVFTEVIIQMYTRDEAIINVTAKLERVERTLDRILSCVDHDELLTEREVAAVRRKTIHALRKERARGAGPPFIKDGHNVRYSKAELLRWLQAHSGHTRESNEPRFSSFPDADADQRRR